MENTKFERRSRRKSLPRWQTKTMKKTISVILAATMVMSLAACGPKTNPEGSASSGEGVTSVPPAAINNQQEEFTKKIVPLNFEPGETISGSLYYKEGVGNDGPYYEFQVEGEDKPTQVPVSQCVIYTVDDPADCKVSKVVFDYEIQGQETQHIEQYRIFSTAVSSITVNGENQEAGAGEDQAGGDADLPAGGNVEPPAGVIDPADADIMAAGEDAAGGEGTADTSAANPAA